MSTLILIKFISENFFVLEGSRLPLNKIYKQYLTHLKDLGKDVVWYTYRQFQLDLISVLGVLGGPTEISRVKQTYFVLNLQEKVLKKDVQLYKQNFREGSMIIN